MAKATIIYNPRAGKVNLQPTLELVADTWRARGWRVRIQPTKAAGHATKLASFAVSNGIDLVLAAGGDGTLGEVVNGLAGSETIMGILPTGTANSFAKELEMPLPQLWDRNRLLQTSDALAAGQVQRMDLGYTIGEKGPDNGRYWLLWAGVGADSFAVSKIEPRPKWSKKLGTIGYLMQGVFVQSQYSHVHATVTVDDHSFTDDYILVLVSNCRQYGGILNLNPGAKLDDGLFEVWLFAGKGLLDLTRRLSDVWYGRHLDSEYVTCVNGRHVTITTEPSMPVQTDGDHTQNTPLSCEIRPGALRLLVPNTAPANLFSQPGQSLPR